MSPSWPLWRRDFNCLSSIENKNQTRIKSDPRCYTGRTLTQIRCSKRYLKFKTGHSRFSTHFMAWPVSRRSRKVFAPGRATAKPRTLWLLRCFIHKFLKWGVNRGSFHTRSSGRIHFSVFRDKSIKDGFTGPKSFRGFRETATWSLLLILLSSERVTSRATSKDLFNSL